VKEVTGWLDSQCKLEERGGAIVMLDSQGYIVGIFSDTAEANKAWPKIRYNIEKSKKRVNLRTATLKNLRPTYHVLYANRKRDKR